MSSYNKTILMGNLTRDPELRQTGSGTSVANFAIATNRRYKDANGDWQDEATFVDVTMFGKRAETFAQYHSKGKSAFIEGSLRLDTWEDDQGNKRSKLYVVADNWEFVGNATREDQDSPQEEKVF
jgi:single-strand DNA-binding protein